MNIFFIETPTGAVAHGVGTYAANLVPALAQMTDLNIFYIQILFGEKGNVSQTAISNKYRIVNIVFDSVSLRKKQEVVIPIIIARAVFCILSDFLLVGERNIFHFNSLLQNSLVDVAKEYNYKTVFTQHVSLWRVFYNNDKKKFEHDWNKTQQGKNQTKFISSIKVEKKVSCGVDKVICLSKEGYLFSRQYYELAEEKLVLIKNGVLKEKFTFSSQHVRSLKQSLGFKESDFVFLFVGRLIEQKGLIQLISAFKILAVKTSNARLIIVGGGAELDKYISLSADTCGRISFTGYIAKEKIQAYYNIANVGIMPSVTEQSSFVVLEMLSKKLPTILSDIDAFEDFISGVHVEKVKTNANGYVYVDLLYKAMKRLYEDSLYRERIARSGHQLFLDQYQASIMAEKTYNVYKEIIAEVSL